MATPLAKPSLIGIIAGLILALLTGSLSAAEATPRSVSGVFPHLAMFNDEQECGTGAVVPWADRLWVITYAPHKPFGSSDKLYEIDSQLHRTIRPESVGGTPANRIFHRESQQLLIGHYLIDTNRHVRVIPFKQMPGRLTGTARHLHKPAELVYYATMEEGFYEVDVRTLAVKELFPDGNKSVETGQAKDLAGSLLPGYHGKGLYSGQKLLIYANNGEHSPEAQQRPEIVSGALAQWPGHGPWRVVRRNQFTEVTGPGGLYGNSQPETDPIWSIGWDHRSLILMLLQNGSWQAFRLPKASHTYDGAHGWNTEWPRIREIGEKELLMTMHGTFWRFPVTFSTHNTAGISPRSTYLKVVGDFCRWKDRIVMGCDDAAKSEFLNARSLKNKNAAPAQSNSGLWFLEPEHLDHLGPVIGRGAVWLKDDLEAGTMSDPYLFNGYERRMVHLAHESTNSVTFDFEMDIEGRGVWSSLCSFEVPAHGYRWQSLPGPAQWIRVKTRQSAKAATVLFQYSNPDRRDTKPGSAFAAWPDSGTKAKSAGTLWSAGQNRRTLGFQAVGIRDGSSQPLGYYELDQNLRLTRKEDPAMAARVQLAAPLERVFETDAASVILVEEGRRYRLPKGEISPKDSLPLGWPRVCREVVTERDLLNCAGTFYELPARNAGGLAKIRPIATHNKCIYDYASYCGMLVVSGLTATRGQADPHVIVSDDKQCALWAGVIDDLWQLGKPRGKGGPWKRTPVHRAEYSDPYLMTGYDRKQVQLSHASPLPVTIRLEIDLDGNGLWQPYKNFKIEAGEIVTHLFPTGFAAYWVRAVADAETTATVQFTYN